MNKLTAAYLAGLIDGEGCLDFGTNKKRGYYQPRIRITLVEKDVILWLQNSFGGGFAVREFDNENWKTAYTWTLNGNRVKPFLLKVRPYLRIKRKQCDILLKKVELSLALMSGLPYPHIHEINKQREKKRLINLEYRDRQREIVLGLNAEIHKLNSGK